MKSRKILHDYTQATAPSAIQMERFSLAPSERRVEKTERGTTVVRGIRIFRAGTFKDSEGVERTWTQEELSLMQENFARMRDLKLQGGVPVREDHSRTVKNIVGWFDDVYVDPLDANYLLGDIEFTEPTAYDKWNRGTYRNRSSEIGLYQTNDGVVFYPAILGVAFVDFGAVEGLYNKEDSSVGTHHYAIQDKENVMDLATWLASGRSEADWIKAVNYAASLEQENSGDDQNDNSDDDSGDDSGEGQGEGTGSGGTTPPANPAPGQPPSNHAAQVGNVLLFGKPATDLGAIQAHITMLENFRAATVSGVRTEFVKKLVKENRLAATQEKDTIDFVQGLTEDQYLSYRKTMENAPTHSLLSSYGRTDGDPQNPQNPGLVNSGSDNISEVDVALEIIDQFQRMGQDEEFIKGTDPYKTLVKHNKAPF